jgi:photosystem II stability/assembly factor-like uncharacterized protein/outer membrane lipoprotein-sorting protein
MKRVLLLFATLALAAGSLSAQTADDIIARYQQAVGGAQRMAAVQTLRRTGKYFGGGGFEALYTQESKRPNRVRSEITLQGMTMVQAYDGKTGWRVNPFQGKKDAEAMGEDEMKGIIQDAEFDDALFDYKAKGNTVQFLGTDQIEGSTVYKLQLTAADNGDVRTYYIDVDNDVPIKLEVKRTVRGAEQEYEIVYGDYKAVNGWYMPFAFEIGPKGGTSAQRAKFTWDRIETNAVIPDSRFAMPAPGTAVEPTAPAAAPAPPAGRPTGKPAAARPAAAPLAAVAVDSETFAGLGARNIGSAAMSGRIAALAGVHEGHRLTLYVGSASGGVWKSENGGTTFKPVFDKEPVQSIGAVTIDPTNPKVVWVGTGESWVRNSVSIGDGVYKSTDGGDTWTNMGLKASERVSQILVDPTSSNTVYVCVPGKLWSDSDERGVYKTTDGGTTWSRILAGANPSTGCAMMSMDPTAPGTLFAGMWDFRRKGWTFRSGGDGPTAPSGSGLFKSTDGGATWIELSDGSAKGLPPKPWGRTAVAIAPSKPTVVYATIEAVQPLDGLYRSDDGGRTWQLKDRSQQMIWRPFYFARLIVDPKNENRIYKPDLGLIVSDDGGKSFSGISGGAHGDFHDLWVDPENTDHLVTGDDGGLWYSYNAGTHWWKADNLPVSQFYHVSVDMDQPYNVYGGLQDNSAWVGPSQYPGGITNHQWENMYGGDGFWMFADPSDPTYLYAEAQGGDIARINRKTHEIRGIKPLPQYGEGKLRFNWNTPIHLSPNQPGTIYIGAQLLFRSTNYGQTWDRISPDLTTNNPEKQQQEQSGGVTVDNSYAEMHTTIYAIAESPKNGQVIWVGTDDGNVQVTQDGGKTWTNVVGTVRGIPKNAWVSSVDAGRFDAGTAFVTFDAHMMGDMRPYAYKTTDYGRTWTPLIAPDAPVRGYAHVIKQDLVNPNLLFLGTEFGLWISVDGGTRWARYTGGNLPAVAVRDLAIHPRDDDLVIATHGRGIWIIDDITPLRALTPQTLAQPAAFFQTRPVVQAIPAFGGWSNGDATFVGPNPPGDAVITYYLQKRHIFGDMTLEVFDSTGKSLGTIPTSKRKGLSRLTWGMRLPPPRVPPAASAAGGAITGPRFLPGTYTLKLTENGVVYQSKITVVPDPRSTHSAADRQAQFQLSLKLAGLLNQMTDDVVRINDMRQALAARAAKLPAGDSLTPRLRNAAGTVDSLRKKIVATTEGGAITGEERLRENLADLYGNVVNYEGRPSDTQVQRADAIARELAGVMQGFDAWTGKEVPALNARLAARGMPALPASPGPGAQPR